MVDLNGEREIVFIVKDKNSFETDGHIGTAALSIDRIYAT
jgi:hypothetical protein